MTDYKTGGEHMWAITTTDNDDLAFLGQCAAAAIPLMKYCWGGEDDLAQRRYLIADAMLKERNGRRNT